jgi:hypothetical protein
MRPVRSVQTSFTAGEVAPGLFARTEVARYYSGAGLLRNMLVRPQGGVRRRPGMRHVATLAGGTDGVRLLPFAFNIEQTYAFVLRAGAFDVFRKDAVSLATVTGCPWSGAQAVQINRAQSADTLLLVHPDIQPQRITRGGTETSWSRAAITFSNIPTFDFGSGAEAVISGGRGWPEAITFHQGRLWIAGFRSRPASFIASKTGDFFNLDVGTGLDDQAIYATIDTDQVNAIHHLASGRALQILTSGAEHVVENVPVTPGNIERVEQTRRGVKRFSTISEVDGATLFVQRGGAALRQLLFSDTEAAWKSDLASLLAPHLILDPIEVSARKSASADDADHVLLTNANGTVTVFTTLRAQEVAAFSRWETTGAIKSACALQSGEVFFATLRNGTVRLEVWDETCRLDASVKQSSGSPFTVVTGLSHLDGLTVQMIGDDAYLGEAVVAGGQVTLPRAASSAEVGLAYDVRGRTLPIEPRDAAGHLIGRRVRIDRVTARVVDSGLFTIEGQPVVMRTVGAAPAAPLDTPPPRVTDDVTVRGLLGHRERAQIEWAQPVPGPLELLALGVHMRVGE